MESWMDEYYMYDSPNRNVYLKTPLSCAALQLILKWFRLFSVSGVWHDIVWITWVEIFLTPHLQSEMWTLKGSMFIQWLVGSARPLYHTWKIKTIEGCVVIIFVPSVIMQWLGRASCKCEGRARSCLSDGNEDGGLFVGEKRVSIK